MYRTNALSRASFDPAGTPNSFKASRKAFSFRNIKVLSNVFLHVSLLQGVFKSNHGVESSIIFFHS